MAKITEDYCSQEVYRLLREKGFDGEIHTTFDEEGYTQPSITLQMAMKWLREVHNLFVEIQYATSLLSQPHTTIYFQIYYMSLDYTTSGKNMLPDDYIREYYTSYEEACEAAIKYCLENLI